MFHKVKIFVITYSLTSVPFLAYAQPDDGLRGTGVRGAGRGFEATETAFIKNPLATGTIQEFLEAILTVVMVLSVPVIIFFLIYAGFLYATARGNSDQIKQATQAFTYAIIGGLIVLGAMVLVGIIQNLVTAFGAEGASSGGSGGSGGSSSSIFSDTVNVGGQPTVE